MKKAGVVVRRRWILLPELKDVLIATDRHRDAMHPRSVAWPEAKEKLTGEGDRDRLAGVN
jgi:hypothetical protein